MAPHLQPGAASSCVNSRPATVTSLWHSRTHPPLPPWLQGSHVTTRPRLLPQCKAGEGGHHLSRASLPRRRATDPSLHSTPPLSSRQRGVAASGPSSPSNQSCDLLQVEDITASHEAALLEMENSHTLTLAILQDDHEHKVQGS